MNNDILLMCKDHIVMQINVDEGKYDILDEKHMPFQLKGKIRPIPEFTEHMSRYELTQMTLAMNNNYHAVEYFLAGRVLPLTRENADKLYALMHRDRLDNDKDKASFAIMCRAISLQDNYWVKQIDDPATWDDVNLHVNSLSETVAQVALHGGSLTMHGGRECTPEFNAQGAYAKAWKREDGDLWLYKLGKKGTDEEAKIEVMVSNILDKCNVDHVEYIEAESNGRYASKCRCVTTEDKSILPGTDFISYCNVNGLNPDREIMRIDPDSIYKMCIVDYLISNRDRHGMNWGYFYDPETMEISGCHPLFDHNNAFDKDWMENKEAEYLFKPEFTMRRAAEVAMERVDFHFTKPITREDFLSDEQYKSFMERAKELKIRTIEQEKEIDTDDSKDMDDI